MSGDPPPRRRLSILEDPRCCDLVPRRRRTSPRRVGRLEWRIIVQGVCYANPCQFPSPPASDLHEMLHDKAERSGQPATALAREALQSWLTQRRRQRIHEEIAAWAVEQAGTSLDLDRDLEPAGLDALEAESSR